MALGSRSDKTEAVSVASKRTVGVAGSFGLWLVFGLASCLMFGACVDLGALQGSSLEAGAAIDAGDGSADVRGSADVNQEPPPIPPEDSGAPDSPSDQQTNSDVPVPPSPDAAAPECPVSEPTGGACAHDGAVCEYGPDPIEACNSVWTCTGKGWMSTVASACPTSPCPASYTDISSGTECTPNDLGCSYPGVGICICTTGPLATANWQCVPATSPCEAPRPRLGRPCGGMQTCDYAECTAGGIEIQCKDDYWQKVEPVCPP
jgi:hypothetical protein